MVGITNRCIFFSLVYSFMYIRLIKVGRNWLMNYILLSAGAGLIALVFAALLVVMKINTVVE